jgi:hypothetical protein
MLWADLKPTHDSLKVLIGARIEEDSSVSDADPATSARHKRGFFHHHHAKNQSLDQHPKAI